MKKQNSIKRIFAIAVAIFAIMTTASADWTTYNASTLPGDASWNVKNGAGDAATMSLVDDAANPGNKILQFISGEADKNTLEAPKFDSKVSGGGAKQAFTVVMRARAIKTSADASYKNFMEVEVKDGEIRDKVRFYPEKGLDIEKANSKELKAYPDGHNSYDFNIYRVTFKDGITKVWINDVLMDESVAASTTGSDSDSRFVIGDSNGSADYGIEYDWIISDNGDAYAPGDGPDYPTELILSPLAGGSTPGEDNWIVYNGSTTPIDYGFTPSGSNTGAANETATPIDDTENAGNKVLEFKTEDDKPSKLSFSNSLSDVFNVEQGFTVVMRTKATAEAHDMIEFYLKSGTHYEKFRFYTDSEQINQEKGWGDNVKVNYEMPAGASMLDWNIYRITMKGSVLNVWVNDILIAKDMQSTNSETTTTNFGFGDGNSGSTYSSLIDWIIWDETGAYAPSENSNYPSELIIAPLTGGVVVIPDFFYFDEISLSMAQAGETLTDIGLEANSGWELSTDDGWITGISPIEGDSGKATFSFQAFSNDGPAPRKGKIYGLIGGVKKDSLYVTQEGVAEKLTVSSVIASSEQVNEAKFNYAANVNDGADTTGWAPAAAILNGASEWIKLALSEKSEVAVVKITESKTNERRTAFKVDYWNGTEYVEVLEKQLTPVQSEANAEMSFAFDGAIQTDTIMFTMYGNTSNSETDPNAAQGWFTYRQLTVWGGAIDDTGILENGVDYSVYPNPAAGNFVIDNAEGADVKLISLSGKVMYQKSNIGLKEQVNVNVPKGLYLLKVDQNITKVVIK